MNAKMITQRLEEQDHVSFVAQKDYAVAELETETKLMDVMGSLEDWIIINVQKLLQVRFFNQKSSKPYTVIKGY